MERFIDHLLPILKAQQSAGLSPLLPPLEPGGDYWDTAFLEAVLESLLRRGETELLQNLVVTVYAWTYGKPLDWGAGAAAKWTDARPYHTPSGSQDQRGFRIFEWYSQIAHKLLGSSPPILVIAGGELPSDDPKNIGPNLHTEKNVAIARALGTDEVPSNVLNFSYYHIGSSSSHTTKIAAWYPSLDQPLPIVAEIKHLSNIATMEEPSTDDKPIQHYVLLPPRPSPDYAQNWDAIGPFVLAVQPAVGFSLNEARLAKRVTLFGDETTIPMDVENELRASGCNVSRFTGAASRAFLSKLEPTMAAEPPTTHITPESASHG